MKDEFLVDLRDFFADVTYSACKINREDVLVTVGHDAKVRIWQLNDSGASPIEFVRQLNFLHSSVIVGLELTLERAITK